MQILIIPIFLILMYVVLLRPQQQRVRRQQQLVTSIGVGDEVVTAGGLIGRVVGLTDDRLQLEVAEGVVIELLRMAVSRQLEPADPGPVEAEAGADMLELGDSPGSAPDEAAAVDQQQVHLPPETDSH